MVDVQEGVESHNAGRVPLQVHNTVLYHSAGHRQWLCLLMMHFVFQVLSV